MRFRLWSIRNFKTRLCTWRMCNFALFNATPTPTEPPRYPVHRQILVFITRAPGGLYCFYFGKRFIFDRVKVPDATSVLPYSLPRARDISHSEDVQCIMSVRDSGAKLPRSAPFFCYTNTYFADDAVKRVNGVFNTNRWALFKRGFFFYLSFPFRVYAENVCSSAHFITYFIAWNWISY